MEPVANDGHVIRATGKRGVAQVIRDGTAGQRELEVAAVEAGRVDGQRRQNTTGYIDEARVVKKLVCASWPPPSMKVAGGL